MKVLIVDAFSKGEPSRKAFRDFYSEVKLAFRKVNYQVCVCIAHHAC
jgi:hypothetical protein